MVEKELCAKEFLEYMRVWKTEMRELSDELSYWKSMAGSSEDGELAFAVADREAYLERRIREIKAHTLSAAKMIDKIEDPIGRSILRRRYLFGETWAKIGAECGGMSSRNAHYIHDNTLKIFEKIFSEAAF